MTRSRAKAMLLAAVLVLIAMPLAMLHIVVCECLMMCIRVWKACRLEAVSMAAIVRKRW